MATYKKRSYVGLTTENVEWHGKRGLLMPNVWTVGIRVFSIWSLTIPTLVFWFYNSHTLLFHFC
jgi:hypothetical protein